MRLLSLRLPRALALALAPATLCLALAGCGAPGSASAAHAAAAPTCPATTSTVSFATVTGKITAASGGTLTITPASGSPVSVQVASTTRMTRLAPTTLSAITVGELAQVTTDASGVVATRITVTGAAGGFRGGNAGTGGQPRATRTPGGRFNPACFRRTGQPGSAFGQSGAQGGRVTEVSTSQITVTDAQGEALSYGVTASTVIVAPATTTSASLVVGATVIATGTRSGAGITARSIIITAS